MGEIKMKDHEKTKELLLTEIKELKSKIEKLLNSDEVNLKTEEALKASEEKFRNMAEQINEVIFLTDSKGKIDYISPASTSIFGYSPKEMEGNLFMKFLKKTEIPKAVKGFTKTIASGKATIDMNLKMITKSKEIFLGELSARVFATKAFKGTIGVIRDITESNKAEEELQAQAKFIDNLIESSALSTWISDKNGTAIRANPACLEFFGATAEEVVGKYNLFQDEVLIKQGFIPQLKKVFEKGEIVDVIIDYNFGDVEHVDVKNATHKIIKSVFTPITDKNNKVINAICQTMDLTDIKKTEEALQESEERFRTLVEQSTAAIEIYDPSGKLLIVNDAWSKFWSLNKETVTDFNILVDPECKKTGLTAAFKKAQQGKAEMLTDILYNSEGSGLIGGRKRWISSRMYPIKDNEGEIQNIILTYVDITERKQAENALRESEMKFRNLFDSMSIGCGIWKKQNNNFILANYNKAGEKMDTLSKDEMLGKNIFELFPDATDKFDIDKIFNEVLETGKSEFLGATSYEVNNILVWRENYIYKLSDDEIVTIFNDITQYKEAEKALKESEEQYRSITETIPGAAYKCDKDWTFNFVSQGFKELTGYPASEIINNKVRSFVSLMFEDDIERINLSLDKAIKRNDPFYFSEYKLKTNSSKIVWVHDSVRIIYDKKGNATSFNGVIIDITEQKNAEEALKESETRFKALHNASFGGITIHDKGLILECNKGLSEITGYKREALIGMDGLLLIEEGSREKVMENILAGYEEPYEAIGVRKNGEIYPLRLEARKIPYKGKDVRVVEFRDITESKKIEDNINQRMTELEIFNDAAVDRELMINDLRKEINELLKELGKDKKYEIVT
jgi:PAS domain S-box-containing protein